MIHFLLVSVASLRKAWEIPWTEIEMQSEIGRGSYGVVYKARWRDMKVAVKTVAGNVVELGVSDLVGSDLDREIAMLQQVRHPNIVLFFGAGTSPDGTPFLVTELLAKGTLGDYLTTNTIEWKEKIIFALDTARGMAHVHSLGRMHRDLKSGNLLVSSSLCVKVADFGTAAIASMAMEAAQHVSDSDSLSLSRVSTQRTKGVGTPLWMAPEILEGKAYGPTADLYSFGIVMWEIAAQKLPWTELPSTNFFADALLRQVLAGTRPLIDDNWPATYSTLMGRCWATSAAERPAFSEAFAVLEMLASRPGSRTGRNKTT
jgi:LRR receptor-like serine/threonine-protein kinase FLS2